MVKIQDFDRFNDTLIGRCMNQDFKALENDLTEVIKEKINQRIEKARDDWHQNCRK